MGVRDSDTSVPIEESTDWKSGIILKACTLESETTSAVIGQEGVLVPQPMANLDFISYPIGSYIANNIRFVENIEKVPRIYAVNYFLRDAKGHFLTHKLAKKVWLHWAEQRIHNEVDAYRTPLGYIPKYEDLKALFQEIFGEDFSEEVYKELFKFRIDPWIAKISRAVRFYYHNAPDCPAEYFGIWKATVHELTALKERYGKYIEPGAYTEK